MKWETFESKIDGWTAKRRQWHRWFAWYPVIMKGFAVPTSGVKLSPDEWIWWENIDRASDEDGNWKYRPHKTLEDSNG